MKNKEMLYIKQNGDCYIDEDCKWGNMNKEDRIKELAKDIGIGFQLSGTTRFGPVAAELVEMGYQRIKKDDIVISKEEYDKYQNLKRDVEHSFEYNQGYTDGQIKGSKETAEKIIIDLIALAKEKQREHSVEGFNPNHMKASEAEWYLFEKHLQNVTAPQFGVEIKE